MNKCFLFCCFLALVFVVGFACQESATTVSLPECEVTDSVQVNSSNYNIEKNSDNSSSKEEEDIDITNLIDMFGTVFLDKDRNEHDTSILKSKIIGIYFSAEWCPPCRRFTPLLHQSYTQLKEEDKAFEVIFVSSDRTSNDMFNYLRKYEMPWFAVEHDGIYSSKLKRKYSIRGIPTLIIIDSAGNTITRDGVRDIMENGKDAYSSWIK